MELPVLVEPTPDGRFRAHVGEPFHVADDAGRAMQDLVRLVERRLQGGARVAVLSVSNGSVRVGALPLPADDAYRTDWVYRELTEAIAEARRLEDSAGP
jgi:hypothetical protein